MAGATASRFERYLSARARAPRGSQGDEQDKQRFDEQNISGHGLASL
jgi:hypothetical protein